MAGFAEGGDPWRGEPMIDVAGVVVAEDAGELCVGGVSGAFAFYGHDYGLGRVPVEEGEDVVDEVAEIFVACQGDGEDAVDEDDAVFGEILGGFGLNSNVEEADAVVELFAGTDCLAADGGEGSMACRGVVGSGDG